MTRRERAARKRVAKVYELGEAYRAVRRQQARRHGWGDDEEGFGCLVAFCVFVVIVVVLIAVLG